VTVGDGAATVTHSATVAFGLLPAYTPRQCIANFSNTARLFGWRVLLEAFSRTHSFNIQRHSTTGVSNSLVNAGK
jgi:hypothetical protein